MRVHGQYCHKWPKDFPLIGWLDNIRIDDDMLDGAFFFRSFVVMMYYFPKRNIRTHVTEYVLKY